ELARDQLHVVGRALVRLSALALQFEQDGLAHQPAGLAGFGLLVGRGHAASSRFEALVEGPEIVRPRLHAGRVVSGKSQSTVAFPAEQAAHLAGQVAMVDAEQALGLLLADRACAILQSEPELVLQQRNSVAELQLSSSSSFVVCGKELCAEFGISRISASF